MGKKVFVNNINIILEGPSIVERAQELHQFLVERLNEVTVNNSPEAVIDLARVSDIDACGCQLLALFMESLKRRGTTPVLAAVPATVRERIESLGFGDLLALQPEP